MQVRFYEAVTPLRAHIKELHLRKNGLSEDLDSHRTQLKSLMEVGFENVNTSDTLALVYYGIVLIEVLLKLNVQFNTYRMCGKKNIYTIIYVMIFLFCILFLGEI